MTQHAAVRGNGRGAGHREPLARRRQLTAGASNRLTAIHPSTFSRPPTGLACARSVLLVEQLGARTPRFRRRGRLGPTRCARGQLPQRRDSETYREPIGVLQGALLGVVGLILAFGLSLAVGRYQDRRAHVVTDANTIGTAYLRAQTIAEPQRKSLARPPADVQLKLAIRSDVRGSRKRCDSRGTAAEQGELQQLSSGALRARRSTRVHRAARRGSTWTASTR